MQKISLKLHKQGMEKMRPLIQQLAAEDLEINKIVQTCKQYTQSKINTYYNDLKQPHKLNNITPRVLQRLEGGRTEDSKAELVFYNLLREAGISFKFQYAIGRYRVDYLISDNLVVELDGPQHNKSRDAVRDNYLRKLGYKVLRIPLLIIAIDKEAVIREIKAITVCNDCTKKQ